MLASARYQKLTMNKRHPSDNGDGKKGHTRRRDLTIIVRQHAPDGMKAELLDQARGLYYPSRFEVGFLHGDGGEGPIPTVWLEMACLMRGEPPRCVRVTVMHGYDPPGITPDRFRRIPLADYTRYAIAAAVGSKTEIEEWRPHEVQTGERGIGGSPEQWRERKLKFDELARRKVGRPRIGEVVDLAEVARVAAAGQPTPTKAVRERFTLGQTTARRWIRRAEAEGHPTQADHEN